MSTLPRTFIHRRLHSLTGLVPIGAFLMEHIFTNSVSLAPNGKEAYNAAISKLAGIPFLVLIEIGLIFLPILFHAFYGIWIMRTSRSNTTDYPHVANFRYMLQRATGIFALIFISYHVYTTRLTSYFTGAPMNYDWMVHVMESPWVIALYIIGTASICFHFANGLWTFLIVWGVTVSPSSQKISLKISTGLFVLLTVVNWLIIANFAAQTHPLPFWIQMPLDFIKLRIFGHP